MDEIGRKVERAAGTFRNGVLEVLREIELEEDLKRSSKMLKALCDLLDNTEKEIDKIHAKFKEA